MLTTVKISGQKTEYDENQTCSTAVFQLRPRELRYRAIGRLLSKTIMRGREYNIHFRFRVGRRLALAKGNGYSLVVAAVTSSLNFQLFVIVFDIKKLDIKNCVLICK